MPANARVVHSERSNVRPPALATSRLSHEHPRDLPRLAPSATRMASCAGVEHTCQQQVADIGARDQHEADKTEEQRKKRSRKPALVARGHGGLNVDGLQTRLGCELTVGRPR
jgi:hypothetical protein